MAKGFKFASKARQERKARSGGASAFAGKLRFQLPGDGDTADVWFLPDDEGDVIYSCWVHEVPVEGRQWPDLVTCIAQDDEGNDTEDDCPGCNADLKRKDRYFVKVLWKDAPVYKKDDKGKIVKDNTGDPVVLDHEDQVAVWPIGPSVEEVLEEVDESYGDEDDPGSGLISRPFRIKRKGLKLDTEYHVRPVEVDGGPKEMKAAEEAVVEESDMDLNDFVKPPSFEEFENRIAGKSFSGKDDNSGSSNGKASKASRGAKKKNPFGRKRRDDDDE